MDNDVFSFPTNLMIDITFPDVTDPTIVWDSSNFILFKNAIKLTELNKMLDANQKKKSYRTLMQYGKTDEHFARWLETFKIISGFVLLDLIHETEDFPIVQCLVQVLEFEIRNRFEEKYSTFAFFESSKLARDDSLDAVFNTQRYKVTTMSATTVVAPAVAPAVAIGTQKQQSLGFSSAVAPATSSATTTNLATNNLNVCTFDFNLLSYLLKNQLSGSQNSLEDFEKHGFKSNASLDSRVLSTVFQKVPIMDYSSRNLQLYQITPFSDEIVTLLEWFAENLPTLNAMDDAEFRATIQEFFSTIAQIK